MLVEYRDHRVHVGDVSLDEADARIAQNVVDVRQIPGVCQLVNDDEPGVRERQNVAREVCAYESGAARNEHCVNQAIISPEKSWVRITSSAPAPVNIRVMDPLALEVMRTQKGANKLHFAAAVEQYQLVDRWRHWNYS
jgi:hypothetical protein